MNLYLISQTENDEYDTYDSMVVAAHDEAAARLITPDGQGWKTPRAFSAWCSKPEAVAVELLGVADPSIEAGIILGSFNAG